MLKIGITNSPEKRIKNLRRDTPFDFEVLEILRVPSGSKAKTIEKRLHDSYESAGLTGFGGCTEWLIFNREILTELKRQVEKAR